MSSHTNGSPAPAGESARRILGLDPGLAVTGYGVIDGDASGRAQLVATGAVRTAASLDRAARLARIHDAVRSLIDEHRPAEVAIEQQFVAENVRTAMAIGEARAAAMVAAASAGLAVFEFSPASIKESVAGWGGAPKEQVQQMVMMQLGLAEAPSPADAADALAVALTRLADARLEAAMGRTAVPR